MRRAASVLGSQVDDADGEQGKPEDEGSGAERGRECACGQQHRRAAR